jgi:DNA topoisomerase I
MKKLIIVESPAKIKTISKFLGKDYKIMSTVGHIKDLPRKHTGISMTNDAIDLEYVVIEDKEKVIADICKSAAGADEVYLAADPDREGEIIAWHIGKEIEKVIKNKKNIHRISFNEITKNAVNEALEHPGKIDEKKVAAQQARRVLDRWVGYEVSPILWQKVAKGLSAGRVQSVALKLICDREQEIRDFKSEEYWSITGIFEHLKAKLAAPLTHIKKKKTEITTQAETDGLIEQIKKESFLVESITDKTRTKHPAPPFMTSTLQQTAYNRLGFPVKKTMQIAQNLYEGIPLDDPNTPVALITYMRTDSLRLSDTAIDQARSFITKEYGKTYLPSSKVVYAKGGKAQDAHEAIRPIDIAITPDMVKRHISPDAAKLYDLIWKRCVACQMKPAEYAQRQVVIQGGKFTFKVTGSTLMFDGFLKVYGIDEEDEKEENATIPKKLKEGDVIDLKELQPKQHFTQAPPRYTEASLVKDLEKEGIGRPSTYAAIMTAIRQRDYTQVDAKKKFVPTELGMMVVKMLAENFPQIMNIKFTAHMEEDLDKIAQGELDRDVLLRNFYKDFEKDVQAFGGPTVRRHSEKTDITCPECNEGILAIRIGKSGHFLGCSRFPECNFTSNFTRTDDGSIILVKAEAPKMLHETCPTCGKPLREISGRFGPFKACSGYPECKYILQEKASFPCPLDKGAVIKKVWKKGTMWGCGNYPKCKFAIFGDIQETPCPQCKLPFLVKKYDKEGSTTLVCNDKTCGYSE